MKRLVCLLLTAGALLLSSSACTGTDMVAEITEHLESMASEASQDRKPSVLELGVHAKQMTRFFTPDATVDAVTKKGGKVRISGQHELQQTFAMIFAKRGPMQVTVDSILVTPLDGDPAAKASFRVSGTKLDGSDAGSVEVEATFVEGDDGWLIKSVIPRYGESVE